MDADTIIEVVLKLCGPVNPVGDSRIDGDRLDHLVMLRDVTRGLLGHIEAVAEVGGDHMASVKAAKDCAGDFLADVRSVAITGEKQ